MTKSVINFFIFGVPFIAIVCIYISNYEDWIAKDAISIIAFGLSLYVFLRSFIKLEYCTFVVANSVTMPPKDGLTEPSISIMCVRGNMTNVHITTSSNIFKVLSFKSKDDTNPEVLYSTCSISSEPLTALDKPFDIPLFQIKEDSIIQVYTDLNKCTIDLTYSDKFDNLYQQCLQFNGIIPEKTFDNVIPPKISKRDLKRSSPQLF